MGTFTAGSIVLVRFPFSDLSQTKLRPAVVLADAGRDDWILCQITSKPYGDLRILRNKDENFADGSLQLTSYVRGSKLFTANEDLMVSQVGTLKRETISQIIELVVSILRASLGKESQ